MITPSYDPTDWYWIVGDDAERAWSSRSGGYVTSWPADAVTRIASEAELTDVLRPYGLRGPIATAYDVRAEASRRMQAVVGARDAAHLEIIIANGSREAIRLLRIKSERPWTEEEAVRAAGLEQADAAIEAIRVASNAMEASPPADFADDARWP